MSKNCDVKIVEFEDYTDLEFREVSNFFIKNCLGQRVYFLTRSREIAQHTSDQMFGINHYRINSGKMSKPSGTESAVGRLSSKSRQGLKTKGH
jgi:hypothetical protein